jgi:hypothetical protein
MSLVQVQCFGVQYAPYPFSREQNPRLVEQYGAVAGASQNGLAMASIWLHARHLVVLSLQKHPSAVQALSS